MKAKRATPHDRQRALSLAIVTIDTQAHRYLDLAQGLAGDAAAALIGAADDHFAVAAVLQEMLSSEHRAEARRAVKRAR